jgi:hypothetical protein
MLATRLPNALQPPRAARDKLQSAGLATAFNEGAARLGHTASGLLRSATARKATARPLLERAALFATRWAAPACGGRCA